MDEQLYTGLSTVLCSLQVYRIKLLGFHWNCRGESFYATHLLMERAYEAVDGFIDRLAECLRKFGVVPAALSVYASCSVIKDELSVPSIPRMLVMASEDGAALFELVQSIISVASQSKQEGVVNLLGDLCETLDTVVYLLKSGTL